MRDLNSHLRQRAHELMTGTAGVELGDFFDKPRAFFFPPTDTTTAGTAPKGTPVPTYRPAGPGTIITEYASPTGPGPAPAPSVPPSSPAPVVQSSGGGAAPSFAPVPSAGMPVLTSAAADSYGAPWWLLPLGVGLAVLGAVLTLRRAA